MERIRYILNGYDLEWNFGIIIVNSFGLLDVPDRKIGYRQSWQELSGEDVDLSILANEPRKIKLECHLIAENSVDAINKFNAFINQLDGTAPKYLYISLFEHNIITGKVLSYLVFREKAITVDKRFKNGKTVWSFDIELQEYLPHKMIYKFQFHDGATSIEFTFSNLQRPVKLCYDNQIIDITQNQTIQIVASEGWKPITIFCNKLTEVAITTDAQHIWNL